MNSVVLIDGNAIGHHYHHATKLSVGNFETQAIFGFVKIVKDIVESYPQHDIIVLWDGQAEFRIALHSGYKANRAESLEDPEKLRVKQAYTAQRPLIQKALEVLGISQMTASNLEADDLAGFMVRRAVQAGSSVLMVTGDSDWLQLVNEKVSWLDPRGSGKRVTHENFLEMTGYHTPFEFLQGKALVGDSSDDIPPVGGIGKKSAPVLLAKFRTVEEFWRSCDAGNVPKGKALLRLWKGTCDKNEDEWRKAYKGDIGNIKELTEYMNEWPGQSRLNFLRNMKLMNLIDAPSPEKDKLSIVPGAPKPEVFRSLCERLSFVSILKDYERFMQPFRKRWAERGIAVTE
jgi:5'-3' exonuclease